LIDWVLAKRNFHHPGQGTSPPARPLSTARTKETAMDDSKPVDHPDQETVEVRQGTGPRATVSVLFVSIVLALTAGGILLVYFFVRSGA
jgi:hypothetical protein